MRKNRNFIDSFKCAAKGVARAVRNERNMRFHITAATVVVFFAYCFGIERTEWIMLTMAIAAVIISEMINTAIENAVDTATTDISQSAAAAKDTAAGAVLVSAVSAAAVGFMLFFDIPKLIRTIYAILHTPHLTVSGILIIAAGTIFVIFGGGHLRGETNDNKHGKQ